MVFYANFRCEIFCAYMRICEFSNILIISDILFISFIDEDEYSWSSGSPIVSDDDSEGTVEFSKFQGEIP